MPDATREDYRDSIELMADEIEDNLGEYADISNAVFEQVDSSRWVFITSKAMKALEYADNDPEAWRGFVGPHETWQEVIQAMAFTAVRGDLYDELRDREGVDL